MNEHYNEDINPIDVREILALITMFSQTLYPYKNIDGTLNDQQPIQCYTGKEATLKRFVNLDKIDRDKMLNNMRRIIPDIFRIWEYIETQYAELSVKAGKRYTSRKYSKYNEVLTVFTAVTLGLLEPIFIFAIRNNKNRS